MGVVRSAVAIHGRSADLEDLYQPLVGVALQEASAEAIEAVVLRSARPARTSVDGRQVAIRLVHLVVVQSVRYAEGPDVT